MSFQWLALITAIAAFLLAMGWLFAGRLMVKRWGSEANQISLVIGRRIGVLYLVVALLFFLARATPSGELISLLSYTGMLANGLLAVLGISEFLKQRVGAGIFISVAVEIFLSLAYARLLFS